MANLLADSERAAPVLLHGFQREASTSASFSYQNILTFEFPPAPQKTRPCNFCASSVVVVTGIIVNNDPVNRWDLLGLSDGTDQDQNQDQSTGENQDNAVNEAAEAGEPLADQGPQDIAKTPIPKEESFNNADDKSKGSGTLLESKASATTEGPKGKATVEGTLKASFNKAAETTVTATAKGSMSHTETNGNTTLNITATATATGSMSTNGNSQASLTLTASATMGSNDGSSAQIGGTHTMNQDGSSNSTINANITAPAGSNGSVSMNFSQSDRETKVGISFNLEF